MQYKKIAESYVVRLEIGDDLIQSLLDLAATEDVHTAEISGLGASKSVTVGIFDPAAKSYRSVHSTEFLEAVSFTGNLTRQDGKPYLHIHALLANPVTGTFLAGHLNELLVGATAEIFVRTLPGDVNRRVCPDTGLNIMDW
ncbi:MAG: DUF296 domain-containing protein [Oscillospiraceae bacterium]|jgi:predicted DNA-binding protein with PD1-like motif|nr:DUF296 domain-containing protein [Oscillospiraceae bacterium]